MRIVSTALSAIFIVALGNSHLFAEDIELAIEPAIAIKVPTTANKEYILEATGNLGSPDWKAVSLPATGDGSSQNFFRLLNAESEFYRAAEYDLSSGLVGYYPLKGNANDFSGNNNHGSISGAVGTEDRFGNSLSAYSFNGINQSISIPSSTVLNPGSGEFSLSYWVKFGTLNQNFHLFGKSDGGGFANKWVVQYRTNPSRFAIHMNTTDGTANSETATAPWSYISNSWVHVVMTKTGSTYQTYLNGNIITETTGQASIPNTTSPLTLGVAEGLDWFQGAIDELRIYNRAISAGEVKALFYQSEVNLNLGLAGYYPFDGDFTDKSGYANTAVNSNAVFSTDRFGRANRAIYFDGTNTVIVPDQAQYAAMTSEMTIATWAQFDTVPRQIHIIGKSEGQFENKKWILYYNSDPQNYSFLIHNPPTTTLNGKVSWPYSTNNWYHLAAVKSGTTYSTYINGVKVATTTGPSVIPTISANMIIGGAEGNAPASPTPVLQFKGKLDDVRFYTRALSSRELKALTELTE